MRLTESAMGVSLLALTFILACAGLGADLLGQGDPPALFGVAAVAGIASIGVGLDEHRRSFQQYRMSEVLLGRGMLVLALICGVVSFILAIDDSPYRNLWLGLAVIIDLVGVAVVLDSHRLVVARSRHVPLRNLTDALVGAVASALAVGLGVTGLVAGIVNNGHAAAFLQAGVVLAVLAVAIMFDEQAHVSSRGKQRNWS